MKMEHANQEELPEYDIYEIEQQQQNEDEKTGADGTAGG